MNTPKEWSKFEFKTDPENGFLVGPDECHYGTEKQAFHYAFLKMCGCGCPEDAFNFCRDVLGKFDRRANRSDDTAPWINAEDAVKALILERPDDAAHVISHLLTHLRLLEHGGSVGGSWLTAWGEQVVDGGPMAEDELSDD